MAQLLTGRKEGTLTVMTSPGHVTHPFTVSDLEETPDDKPTLTAFELANGEYKQIAHVTGGQAWTAGRPFPVRVVPADLVRGLRP